MPERFFAVKMATQDLTSPVAAMYLAAAAFFSVKMATKDLTSPDAAMYLAAGAFLGVKMATKGLEHVDFCLFCPILRRLKGLRVKVGEGGRGGGVNQS